MKHRRIQGACQRCGRDVRAGLTYCRQCGIIRRRAAAIAGWKARKRMVKARASR